MNDVAVAQEFEKPRGGLGMSDAAAVLGLSKWQTPVDLFLRERGQLPKRKETRVLKRGKLLEQVICDEYEETTGRKLRRVNEPLKHPTYPFLWGTLDRDIVGEDGIFEAKSARFRDGWGEPGTDVVPLYYLPQVQGYMGLKKASFADVGVVHDIDLNVGVYTVKFDRAVYESMIERMVKFWEQIQSGVAPAPSSMDDVLKLYPRNLRGTMTNSGRAQALIEEYRKAQGAAKLSQSAAEEIKTQLCLEIGDMDGVCDAAGDVLATWKASKVKSYTVPERMQRTLRLAKE